MGLNRNRRQQQISLIWVTISLIALSQCQKIPSITNLHCFNDFQSKIFCFWDIVGSSNNCSEDFTLTYTNDLQEEGKCNDLQTEQFAVPVKCICNITVEHFIIAETYAIKVESHGQPVDNKNIPIGSTFKLQAPSNVRLEFPEEETGLVQWTTNYEKTFLQDKLSFHVQILFKNDRKVAKEDFLTQLEPRYKFSKRQLKRGDVYVLSVRTKPAQHPELKGTWSEWSSESEWRNDYKLTILDLKEIIIPITCIVILCLIIANYVLLTRYRKKWLNNIPDPGKSQLAQSTLLQRKSLNPDGQTAAKKSCGKFFTSIVKSHKSRCDQLTQQYQSIDYVNISESYYFKTGFFEPEVEDIERCVEMYSKNENENPVQEDKTEHKAEDPLLEGDLSIAKMFFDILCESSGIKVDTFENFNTATSLGCSGWMDSFGKKETQRCNSDVSTYQESGYNSYGSEDSPLYFLSDIDTVNTSYFGQWPDNETECTPYTPLVSNKDNCLYQKEGAHLESPDYNSLTSALNDTRKNLIIDTSKTFCLDSLLNNIVLCKNNSHKRLMVPKSILYYNRKNALTLNSEDNFQSILKPKPEHASKITLECYESNSDPTSVCHVSGYQSFDQAVQENELGCHTSGYKSFDLAVLNGGPDSGYQGSGYRSFDQAVKQGDVVLVNGYQSFDHAAQQNETSGSTNCTVLESGYKPLENILQNGEYSTNHRQHQLGEIHCQINTESPQTETFVNVTDDSYNKTVSNSQKHELLSGLTEFWLEDFVNSAKQKYHPTKDFSDKSIKALKTVVDTYNNDLPKTLKNVPFALTFDICEHLRNLENMQGHKVPLNKLIFNCHRDDIQFVQEQLKRNAYLDSQEYPPTKCDNFENLSYFFPLCDLEALGSNPQAKYLLIQQINVDKDGNSYMKLALP